MNSDGFDVQFPRLAALLRYWNQKRRARPMPARRDIDPIEIPSLLPIVVLARVKGGEVRMRIMGEDAVDIYRRDVRDREVRDFEFGAFTKSWVGAFDLVIASEAPAVAAGLLTLDARACRAETVLMPLSDEAGALSHVFGGLVIRPIARDDPMPMPLSANYVLPLARGRDDNIETRMTRLIRARGRGRIG
jgi:hypothetical protein